VDDGGIDGNGLKLDLNSFTLKDLKLLQSVLKEKFDLNSNRTFINRKRNLNQFKLYIKVESMDHLRSLVKPFIVPSIDYKINIKNNCPLFLV
jgi:hypothetical protein